MKDEDEKKKMRKKRLFWKENSWKAAVGGPLREIVGWAATSLYVTTRTGTEEGQRVFVER